METLSAFAGYLQLTQEQSGDWADDAKIMLSEEDLDDTSRIDFLAHFLQVGAAGYLQLTQEQADDWAENAHLMLCISAQQN